jgi:uncharacterized protein GlcG (DUF336 family)
MSDLTLAQAQKILTDALTHCRTHKFNPMAVVVVDARGAIRAAASEDNTSLIRWKIAFGKASGCIALGSGSRKIGVMAVERPYFVAAASHLNSDGLVPVAGGVLIRDANKNIIGAVGVSGDTSDNDEAAAISAIQASGFVADAG